MVSDRRAFRFRKGARVLVSAGITVWIVEQIGIDETSYMIATSGGSVKILDWRKLDTSIQSTHRVIK